MATEQLIPEYARRLMRIQARDYEAQIARLRAELAMRSGSLWLLLQEFDGAAVNIPMDVPMPARWDVKIEKGKITGPDGKPLDILQLTALSDQTTPEDPSAPPSPRIILP